MVACKEVKNGINPRSVKRGLYSHDFNEVGIHWLRISFNLKDLQQIMVWISNFFGEPDILERGFWGYDRANRWASGAMLLFDSDDSKCKKIHQGRITFECPGRACDELTAPDLLLLMDGFMRFGGFCKRIDVFFDDYKHLIEPTDLHDIIKRNDFSGFRKTHIKQTMMSKEILHDEVSFGSRNGNGTGKYLRVYDKRLESKGEKDCVRWEVEFTQPKADRAFTILAGACGDLEAFATICGALIGGCMTFVHRTGDKNISRLDVYEFWDLITESLGKLKIRIAKKKNTLTGVIEWTERQVAPSLACVRKTFVSDQKFIAWVMDMLDESEFRFNANQRQIVSQHEGSMNYDPKINEQQQDSDYVRLKIGRAHV